MRGLPRPISTATLVLPAEERPQICAIQQLSTNNSPGLPTASMVMLTVTTGLAAVTMVMPKTTPPAESHLQYRVPAATKRDLGTLSRCCLQCLDQQCLRWNQPGLAETSRVLLHNPQVTTTGISDQEHNTSLESDEEDTEEPWREPCPAEDSTTAPQHTQKGGRKQTAPSQKFSSPNSEVNEKLLQIISTPDLSKPKDEVEMFLSSLAPQLKKLDPRNQLRAKMCMLQMLGDLELSQNQMYNSELPPQQMYRSMPLDYSCPSPDHCRPFPHYDPQFQPPQQGLPLRPPAPMHYIYED
ncbi:hypothetical protein ABVT39_012370 [Epinephelus coioides]